MDLNIGTLKRLGISLVASFATVSMLSGCGQAPAAAAGSSADNTDDKPASPVSQEFKAMKCHEGQPTTKKHGVSVLEESEHPMYLEGRRWTLKPEYEEAHKLWQKSKGGRQIVFDFRQTRPNAGGYIDKSNIDKDRQGVIIMGCTDKLGPHDYNLGLSFERASHIAEQFEGYEVCILPLGEYCDDLGFTSTLRDNRNIQHAKNAHERFVSVRTYNRTFDIQELAMAEPSTE